MTNPNPLAAILKVVTKDTRYPANSRYQGRSAPPAERLEMPQVRTVTEGDRLGNLERLADLSKGGVLGAFGIAELP